MACLRLDAAKVNEVPVKENDRPSRKDRPQSGLAEVRQAKVCTGVLQDQFIVILKQKDSYRSHCETSFDCPLMNSRS